MNAKELKEKTKLRRENREAIQEYWSELFPELVGLNQKQANAWLIQYDIDTVMGGLDSASIKVNKVDHAVEHGKGEEMTTSRVIKYASMCMRNAGLSVEERQALDEKRNSLRAARSAAAHKRWDKVAKSSENLPEDVEPLPQFASVSMDLHRGTGTGSGTGTNTGTGRGTGSGTAAAQPTLQSLEEKKEQTKTNINPVGASGLSANQSQEKPKATSASVPVKHSWKKCPKCGVPMYREVNHVCAVKCSCEASSDGTDEHSHNCAITVQERIAKYGNALGVEEL